MTAAMTGSEVGTLLGVWAHPDDEAYLSAALMAFVRRSGQRVVVVTATAGEHGTNDPARWPPARLARRRRRELAASLAAVGVHEHHWLGYEDGTCADVPEADAIGAVERIMDQVRPHTVVTFGPDGMTGHPDHCAISAWTTAAWRRRGGHGRLWYASQLDSFHDEWGELNQRIGVFGDQVPPRTPAHEAAAVVYCESWLLERKQAALRAHASQVQPLIDLVGEDVYRRWWSTEAFVDAAASDALNAVHRVPIASSVRNASVSEVFGAEAPIRTQR
jgi:LmbE family N-acetylglucosaminyl deacetylase